MPQGIEVYGDSGNFQFGVEHRGMKIVKKIVISPNNIILDDTGNSLAPNYYLNNHWWTSDPSISPDALIAVRPLDKGVDFYVHFARGQRSWFNTPAAPTGSTLSVFVSRPCEVYVYDYPPPPPAAMAGLVVYDVNGRPTFSSDGVHMRLASFQTGNWPSAGAGQVFDAPGPVTTYLPSGEYMICPLCKPYQIYLSDQYNVGGSTIYDFNEWNAWYNVGSNYVSIIPKIGFNHGLNFLAYSDVDSRTFSNLILYANWEMNLPQG